uniref:Uncharacterized protein n=1 Tax=Pseudonaja textilis TaxID=8673 RepID=A0A670ZEP3_PSETE
MKFGGSENVGLAPLGGSPRGKKRRTRHDEKKTLERVQRRLRPFVAPLWSWDQHSWQRTHIYDRCSVLESCNLLTMCRCERLSWLVLDVAPNISRTKRGE